MSDETPATVDDAAESATVTAVERLADEVQELREEVEKTWTDEDIAAAASRAPNMPWEIILRSCSWTFTPMPDGSIILHLIPAVATPAGTQMMPPAIAIPFPKNSWELFKQQVAADGKQSNIVTAKSIPVRPNRGPALT